MSLEFQTFRSSAGAEASALLMKLLGAMHSAEAAELPAETVSNERDAQATADSAPQAVHWRWRPRKPRR
jgi:hypothetical protein